MDASVGNPGCVCARSINLSTLRKRVRVPRVAYDMRCGRERTGMRVRVKEKEKEKKDCRRRLGRCRHCRRVGPLAHIYLESSPPFADVVFAQARKVYILRVPMAECRAPGGTKSRSLRDRA
ncbi:hypothetical protein MRX96_018927 [Rhipicephalus microplus]